jgi:hypothetical protein
MMTTTAKLGYVDKSKFTAVSLPLHENTNAGNFIVILPKEQAT